MNARRFLLDAGNGGVGVALVLLEPKCDLRALHGLVAVAVGCGGAGHC
jgi:hypothetical protein